MRYNCHLKGYITDTFYKNWGWIFIVMSFVRFYFTLNETLVATTEQETLEFPVMAAKLFGEFAPAFWGMNILNRHHLDFDRAQIPQQAHA